MKLKLAYIQAENGIPASDPFYRAWDGFRKRGIRCELFEAKQLEQGTLPLSRDTLVSVSAVSLGYFCGVRWSPVKSPVQTLESALARCGGEVEFTQTASRDFRRDAPNLW